MSKITISLASEVVGHFGPLEIRNTMLMAWFTMIVLFVLCFALSRTKYRLIPGRFQALVEIVRDGAATEKRRFVDSPATEW